MTWPVQYDARRVDLEVEGRISKTDAQRQQATVGEILRRMEDQPGVVLADEVGMGKTFVALAVAAHAAWGDEGRNPVVVMVPSALKRKWPTDFGVFRNRCIQAGFTGAKENLEAASADEGVGFLKLLDDPLHRRKRVIFLSHSALYRGLQDPWTKLAILQAALHGRGLSERRGVFHRFVGRLLRIEGKTDEPLFEDLLGTPPADWRRVMKNHGQEADDDPVPASVRKVLDRGRVDLGGLRGLLLDLPIRTSTNIDERVKGVRQGLAEPLRTIWSQALKAAHFRSPLLILDEAHHLKNPATELASLFVEEESEDDATRLQAALQGRFERMLFLTATPFQLGHQELMKVLDRFRGIRWEEGSPRKDLASFTESMEGLGLALDAAQRASAELDQRWQTLIPTDIGGAPEDEGWWDRVEAEPEEGRVALVRRLYEVARLRMREAETHLRPWVIRHLRPRTLLDGAVARRNLLPGASILDGNANGGLPVDREALLPFLLAGRAQALVSARSQGKLVERVRRATFAEGLASSFEAYLETRKAAVDTGDAIVDEIAESDLETDEDRRLKRYLDHLTWALPGEAAYFNHPKIKATVNRVAALWTQGEKVLVFCHFRATGRALTSHISRRLEEEIEKRAAEQFGCEKRDVRQRLSSLTDAFERGRPARRLLDEHVAEGLLVHRGLTAEQQREIAEVVARFVRTDSFLVRYFPLAEGRPERRLLEALEHRDASGLSLSEKLKSFLSFLADRCEPEERSEYLEALGDIQTGLRYARSEEGGDVQDGRRQLAAVRRATGEVKSETRRRLLLGFNTPFYPEVLVASSVLAEGVDLHLDCRHVIHHDLCWNPSTLEQRTGRIDRIGAKAERVNRPIQVYLPYVGGTQDEKMFRVVRDRERWFQVVMGEKYALDENTRDRLATRVPLPEKAARDLAFRLEVVTRADDEPLQGMSGLERQGLL